MAKAKFGRLSANPCFKKVKPHPALVRTIESTFDGFLQTTGKGNVKQALIDAVRFHLNEAREDLANVRKQIIKTATTAVNNDNMQEPTVVPLDQPTAVQTPALSRNSKGNIELKFPAKPDAATIEQLSTIGFQFNQKQKVWYAGDTLEAIKLAEELSGSKLPEVQKKKKVGLRNFLTEIKDAGGIKPQSLVDALDKNDVSGGRWLRIKNKSGFGVDQMAIRMQSAGWMIPVDLDGNPDADAFAQLLKGAINGNLPVHPDNADQAVAVQELAVVNQIAQLTDEDLDLQSLLNQDDVEVIQPLVDGLLADLYDELDDQDYNAISPIIQQALVERDAAIQEVEYGINSTEKTEYQGGITEGVSGTGAVATGETAGSTGADKQQTGSDTPTPAGKSHSEIIPPPADLASVPAELVAPDLDLVRTAANPVVSLPSLDDFSKLFDQMVGVNKSTDEQPVKSLSEVVSTSGEVQNKLFATPPAFGKKPQTKDKAVGTGDLLDNFTAVESVQPDMFSASVFAVKPSVEDSKAAIRAILAAAKKPESDGTVREAGDDGYNAYALDLRNDETYQLVRPHILNLWQDAWHEGGELQQVVPAFITSLLRDFGADIKPHAETFYREILNGDILVSGGSENVDAQHSGADLERNSIVRPENELGEGTVQSGGRGSDSGSLQQGSKTTGEAGNTEPGTDGVSGRETVVAGTGRNSEVQGTVVGLAGSRPAGSKLNQRGSDFTDAGLQVEPAAAAAVDKAAERNAATTDKREQQRLAQKVAIIPGDLDNIRQSLPLLLPGQDTDVQFAENRFAKPDGFGVLFTNGTGTGKTFSGLGIIKRLERQGKTNTLIVVPGDNVIKAWRDAARLFGLELNVLKDTNDAGSGIVITTFANFAQNSQLVTRAWDLVVADEAQYLNSNKTGAATNAQNMLQAITLHPSGYYTRANNLHAKLLERYQAAHEEASTATNAQKEALSKQWREAVDAVRAEVTGTQPADRTRVVFLSATPFAYHKSIDYANGYLFDYDEGQPKDESRAYNSGSNYDRFMMTHFGYRMRTNKLTEPPAEVNVGLMERQFNSWLKKRGVLSGRMLAVEHDYDRKFVLIDSAIGRTIDEGLEFLRSRDEYRPLYEQVVKRFDYLSRRFLLEAIKAKEVIPQIRDQIAAGRKVVVFHDYNQGGGMNPFDLRTIVHDQTEVRTGYGDSAKTAKLGDLAKKFVAERPDLVDLPFASYGSALSTLKGAFPDALTVNGTNSKKVNLDAVSRFQQDNNGDNLIIVQADKGKEGISLHDTTGVHQRVLFNLGLPVKPTMAIQQEGRIYRTGQASNAMFRYLNTGTSWERYAFATTLARRASTAENMAMGEEARMLLDAYIEAYQDSDAWPVGHEGEGTGGKERDRAANAALTEWDRAVSYYYAQQKGRKNNISTDYFATPEPLGLKMAEWADVWAGETVLEPSGGHGAIARWFNDLAKRRAIEPSMELASKLALVFDGDIVQGAFEDHHTVNKYDAIVMNPPFGSGGKTAVEHVAKAAQHLKDNGRIVALIPSGPAMDKRFDKWLYDEKVEKVEPLYTDAKLGDIYRGDTITIQGFGTTHAVIVGSIVNAGSARFVRPKGADPSQAINLIAANKIDPTGPREKRISNPMHLTAEILLPAVTFERAGTKVMTRIVVLDKGGDNSFSRRDYTYAENIKDFFERIQDASIPGRTHNSQPNNEVTPVTADQVTADGEIKPGIQQTDDFDLAIFKHSRTGETMYIATLNRKDAALYARANSLAKQHKGYYSKYKQGGAIAGFLFTSEENRNQFLQAMGNQGAINEPEPGYSFREGTTDDQAKAGQHLVDTTTLPVEGNPIPGTGNIRGRLGTGRILASEISTELRKNGVFSFVGKTVSSPVDLAAIAQVYRNPKYETLRYFFIKDNRIVGQLGVSSRLPGVSKAYPGQGGVEDGTTWLRDRMRDFGADGYYLLHNHPNGDVTNSPADLDTTRDLAAAVPGFIAHVIINHNIYNTILPKHLVEGSAKPEPTVHKFGNGPDQVRLPGKPSPFLGSKILHPDDLAALGKSMEIQAGQLLLVVTDSKDQITGLAEVPMNETPVRLGAYIKRLALKAGSPRVYAVVPDQTASTVPQSMYKQLQGFADEAIKSGFLRDVIFEGMSVASSGTVPGQKRNVYFGKQLFGRLVNQSAWHGGPYDITAKFSLNDEEESFAGLQAPDLRKEFGDRITVVQSADQIPEKVAADAEAMGVKPWNIEAFVHDGKVWLVADNIRTVSRARELAFGHELAHLGQDEKIIDLAAQWFKATVSDQNSGFKKVAHDLLQEEATKRHLDLNDPEQHRVAVREATARMAEDMAKNGVKPGLIQKIVNYLRELLRKWYGKLKVTDQELAGAVAEMLRQGEKRLKEQHNSATVKERGENNGTESGVVAEMQSRIGRVQAGHFKDAKAIVGRVYSASPEDARRSQIRDEEAKQLKTFAEQNDLMLDAAPMKRQIDLQGISGVDNLVYYHDGAFIKANKFTHTGTFTDLFINISLHNKVFPEAAYTFEGFTDLDGMFRPVFSQEAFNNDMVDEDQRRELERLAADTLVNIREFTRVDGDFKIISQASFTRNDIVVRDINYRNVLHYNGKIIFFDPIIELRDEARTPENMQSLLNEDESENVQFSLRSDLTDAVKNIPWEEVLPTMRQNWLKIINPLDWSTSYRFLQDALPEQIKAGFGWLFTTPTFQAERHAEMRPFVDTGEQREVNRMQIMLDFLGYLPGMEDTRSALKKGWDFFTKWQSGPIATEWEQYNQMLFALTPKQRRVLDLVFAEGDANGSKYDSLNRAKMNPRLRDVIDQQVFDLYKKVRDHIDVDVRDARIRHMETMMRTAGMEEAEIARHITDYRNELRYVRGWLPRNHGAGREQVAVYHLFEPEQAMDDWGATTLYDKDGEISGMQYFLSYYPGKDIMAAMRERIKEGFAESDAKLTTNAKGQIIITITGDPQAMDEIGDHVVQTVKGTQRVMRYMRRFQTVLGAREHAKKVEKDYHKAMPRVHNGDHAYETVVNTTDGLTEDLFQAMRSDYAVEAAMEEAVNKAFKRGEIDDAERDKLKQQIVRDQAEVLMGRAAGRYQIRRAPYLIEGYDLDNSMSQYQDYMMGTVGMLSKAQYALEQMDNYRKAPAKIKPWAGGYIFDSLRNMGLGDRLSGDVRSFAALWFMGLKVSSALINATQPFTLGYAELGRRVKGGFPAAKIAAAEAAVLGNRLTVDERQIFESVLYKQQEMQTAIGEISGHNEGSYTKAGRYLQAITSKSLALFQHIEMLNRKTMILAGYRAFRSDDVPAGVIDQEALQAAMEINDQVNFNMGRHNLPGFARKAIGRTAFSLQSFSWGSLNWIFNRLTSGEKTDMIALLRYVGAIALLGGVLAIPGVDELDKLYRKLKGRSLKLDLQEWSVKHARKYGNFGDMINAFAWHGLPSVAGIDATNALRLQMPVVSQVLSDKSALDAATGVPGALVNKVAAATTYAGRDNYARAIEALAPEAVAGPMRAVRQYKEGATTSHGKPLFNDKGQPLKYSAGDVIKRGLGFQPYQQARQSEQNDTMKAVREYWNTERKDLLDAVRFDKGKLRGIDTNAIRKFNRELADSQAAGLVLPITADAIRSGLTYRPDRKQAGWKRRHSY